MHFILGIVTGKRQVDKGPVSATAAVAQVRRLCANPARCTLEVLLQWRAGGEVRKNLVKEWMSKPDVVELTADIILQDEMKESLDITY